MRVVLKEHYYDILNRHGYVTAEMVKNAFTGVTPSSNLNRSLTGFHVKSATGMTVNKI